MGLMDNQKDEKRPYAKKYTLTLKDNKHKKDKDRNLSISIALS